MTPEKLKKLRSKLPVNYRTVISERLEKEGVKLSGNTIYNVLAGIRTNQRVIEEAILLAQETEQKKEELSNAIDEL